MTFWDRFRSGYDNPLRQGGGAPNGYSTAYGGVAPMEQYGLPGFKQFQSNTQQFADERGGGPFRGQQEALAGILMRQAQGQDSLSAEQLRQQTGRLQAMQASMAAGARPSNAAMASRLAMQNAGEIGGNMAGNAAMAGIAERQAAANSLGGVLQGARGQDIDAYIGSMGLGLQAAQSQQQGMIGREQIRANRYGTAMQSPTKRDALYGVLQGLTGYMSGAGG